MYTPLITYANGFSIHLPKKIATPTLEQSQTQLVDFLQTFSGEKFHISTGDDLTLLRNSLDNKSAIVITAAHTLGALAEGNQIIPIAMFDDITAFVVVVDASNESIYQLKDLSGQQVCAEPVPALFTLHLLFSINNPNREPAILPLPTDDRKLRQLGMGNCAAAIINIESYLKAVAKNEPLRIVFQSRTMPTYGIGINESLPLPLKHRLQQMLSSKEGGNALQPFIVSLTGAPGRIIEADLKRLKSLSAVLKNWGF